MKHLYYCRHGLSLMNQQGLLAGSTDTPLVDEGRAQAHAAGKSAQKLGIDLIVTSPLSRAKETADIIADELGLPGENIVSNELLRERDFGELEGSAWYLGRKFDHESSVEPYEDIMARAQQAKNWLETLAAGNILLVSHGSFIRAIRSLYQPEKVYADASASMPNAEIVQLV